MAIAYHIADEDGKTEECFRSFRKAQKYVKRARKEHDERLRIVRKARCPTLKEYREMYDDD